MKRWLKNLGMVLVCIICLLASVTTIIYANNHIEIEKTIDSGEVTSTKSTNVMTTEPTTTVVNEETTSKTEEKDISDEDVEETFKSITVNTRSFNINYYFIFGVIAVIFSLEVSYLILSSFNKKSYDETFAYSKRYVLYTLTLISVTIFYFIAELLIGYIVLNYDTPEIKKNIEDSSIIIKSDLNVITGNYVSTTKNSNAVTVNGNYNVVMNGALISKEANGTDNSSGRNAAIAAKGGANVTLNGVLIQSTGSYSNGLYSVDEGTKVVVNKSSINTAGEMSSTVYVSANVVINTSSITSASAGVVALDDAFFSFSSGNIHINNNNTKRNFYIRNEFKDHGNATFNLNETILEYGAGNLFDVLNNDVTINLKSNIFTCTEQIDDLISLINSKVVLNVSNQNITGNVILDNDSSIVYTLTNSTYNGSINKDYVDTYAKLVIDANSRFNLTNDTYLNELIDADESLSNINTNGYSLYLNNVKIK